MKIKFKPFKIRQLSASGSRYQPEPEKPKGKGRLAQLSKRNRMLRKQTRPSEFLIMAQEKDAILGPAI